MPLQKLQFRPGVNREGTNYANEGGWYDCDKIRFRSGSVEKIGGWTRLSADTFLGVARSLWNWVDLNGNNYLGIGTNIKYYVELGTAYNDITPVTSTQTLVNKLSTAYSTLNGGITASQTTLTLTSAASFPPQGIIKIDTEQIYYTGVSTNTLTGLTRGYNGTTAASHLTGAGVGCATITMTDASNSGSTGDYILIAAATGFGGISATALNGNTTVGNVITESLTTPGVYYYNAYNPATPGYEFSTSQVTNAGGTITVSFLLSVGLDVYTIGTGWGTGPWSRGGWGSGYTSGFGQQLRLWSNDNYGQDLVIAPRGGSVYYWQPSGTYTNGVPASITTRAQKLSDLSTSAGYSGAYVPTTTNQVIASAIQRFVICLGANSYVSGNPATPFNPMLVRWSDQLNQYQWIPAVTNQSGEFTLSNGSYIMAGRATRQEILIWTDSCLYSMQYLGAPYVWGFNILMDNISVMSPNSMITINNITYWMGNEKFYMYSGRVETLPCTVRQYVFDDINQEQAYQVICGANEGYNEVWWFYCSISGPDGTGTTLNPNKIIDRYVIYNYLERIWYYGNMSRTAWLDSGIRTYPMATNYDNRVLYHESNVDDVSGLTPVPIEAYIQSSDFDIGDGHNFGFVWRILPDVNFNGSNVNQPSVTMAVRPRVNAGTPYGTADTPIVPSYDNFSNIRYYNIQEFDGQVYTRLRGRQMAFRISSDSLGVAWQLGAPRIDIRPDGRR